MHIFINFATIKASFFNQFLLLSIESKMLLFNGLYFKGEWAQNFEAIEQQRLFQSYKDKQDVTFIQSNGLYKYVEIPSQNLKAIEIPYKVFNFCKSLIKN